MGGETGAEPFAAGGLVSAAIVWSLVAEVRDEPKYVAIASSVSNEDLEEDHVGNTLTIPRGMIMTMRELRLTTATARVKKSVPATAE